MRIRYYIDPAMGQPHIYQHNVQEDEVEDVLARPIEKIALEAKGHELRSARRHRVVTYE